MTDAFNPALQSGTSAIRSNVQTLMGTVRSRPRKKAILTISKRHNISRTDAQFRQAVKISQRLARKP